MKNILIGLFAIIAVIIIAGNYLNDSSSDFTELQNTENKEGYTMSVIAVPLSSAVIELKIKTDMPLPVEVMAGVSIKNQKPTDTYIGYSEKVTLNQAIQTLQLDISNASLPDGEYLAEVNFYPRWGADIGTDDAKKIDYEIFGVVDIILDGSGVTKEAKDAQNIAQKWAMENVVIGTEWHEKEFVGKLGTFVKSKSELNFHTAYYFEVANMTILVNDLKSKVTTWRFGDVTK